MAIHARQVERYGGAHGVLDENVVHSALARPRHLHAHEEEADLASFAASYLVGFARSRGFRDGNKRAALACALVFLMLNRYELHVPPGELNALKMRVTRGQADDRVVPAYFRDRMTRTDV